MNEHLSLTQLLYSCWIVSGTNNNEREVVPTKSVLAYALQDLVDRGMFPEWARRELHFVSADTGLICVELASIESLATELKIISYPYFSYSKNHILVGKPWALRYLSELEISEEKAKVWGNTLRQAVVVARVQMRFALV